MRQRNCTVASVSMMLVLGTVAVAVSAAEAKTIQKTRLTDRLWLLSTDQGSYTTNTIASVGDDGILLVDTQSEADAVALRDAVEEFGKGGPRIIVNTHRHVEHVGGNAIFGEAPVVIAHNLVRSKLRSGSYLFEEFPEATLPDISFEDSLTVHFNGEPIRLWSMAGSHDDNEIVVHFTESKVVHLSSLVNGFNFPSVDRDGSVLAFPKLVARAIELLPEDVTIVSGHNRTGSVEDLRAYHEMLVGTIEAVRKGLESGKDVEALQKDKVLDQWQAYAGSYVSTNDWIEYVADALKAEPSRPFVFEPLYHAWKDRGAEAAVALYREMRRDRGDEFDFRDVDLMIVGGKLVTKGHYDAAVAFLKASLEDYPESEYGYYVCYQLAQAHEKLGHGEEALRYARQAREKKPDSAAVAELIERLEAKRQAPK